MTLTTMGHAIIDAGIENPQEKIKNAFFNCVRLSPDFRAIFQKIPNSERAQEKAAGMYHQFVVGYNMGEKSVNRFQKPGELYQFPENIVEIAKIFGFQSDTILGAWCFLVYCIHEQGISGVYENNEERHDMNFLIRGTLAVVEKILDSKDSDEQREIIGLVRNIQKGIGGNLKGFKRTGDKAEFEHLGDRVREQLTKRGIKYDEHEVVQIIQKIVPYFPL